MHVDNFSILAGHYKSNPLHECNDHFLFGQILCRKKDGGKYTKSNNKVIKDLVFRTPEEFDSKKEEIVELCKLYNARAYVNVNPRSYKDVAIEMAGLCLDYIRRGSESASRTVFSTVCGRLKSKGSLWIIDVDDREIIQEVANLLPNEFFVVPTVNGIHYLTSGFDTRELKSVFPNVDIHKNNPTLLYFNDNT